jgi:hypothetical protein
MRDVDGLNRRFDNTLLQAYKTLASQLSAEDRAAQPLAYCATTFLTHNPLKCKPLAVTPSPLLLTAVPTSPSPLNQNTAAASFINFPIWYHPSIPTPDPMCSDPSFPMIRDRNITWMSLTPQFGSIPYALASHQLCFIQSP